MPRLGPISRRRWDWGGVVLYRLLPRSPSRRRRRKELPAPNCCGLLSFGFGRLGNSEPSFILGTRVGKDDCFRLKESGLGNSLFWRVIRAVALFSLWRSRARAVSVHFSARIPL